MITGWWRGILGFTIMLSCTDVIFGISNLNNDTYVDFMNLTILYAKYFISLRKKNNEQLFFIDYVRFVKDRFEIEKVFCEINQLDTFERRWKTYYESI